MKRVVIFHGYPGRGAGAERVLEYLLQGAATRKDEICLLAPETSSVTKVALELGYPWIEWSSTKDAYPQNFRAFVQTIRGQGRQPLGDIVHAWHTRGLEWAWLLGRCWNAASAGTLHDDPEHPVFGRMRKEIIRKAAAHLDGVAVVSEGLRNRCQELGWKKQISILRNGLPEFPPATAPASESIRIGFMAITSLWKGIDLLPKLIEQTRDLPLLWNLFGRRSEETDGRLNQLTEMDGVRYFGVVPLDEALSRIDILLHLSLTLDPYPTVLLEAARAGLPAIATTTGGSPEIVVDGETGLLIPPANLPAAEAAIRRLANSPMERADFGKAARIRYERHFRVEQMVADYFAFWNGLRSSRQ